MKRSRIPPWRFNIREGPIVAAAVHNGHDVRQDVARLLALAPAERFREEDAYTGRWTIVAPTQMVVQRSRFEVDFNRPRAKAVYQDPADAWGLTVWREPLPERVRLRSLSIYDEFYRTMHVLLTELVRRHGHFVVLDLHSYNHRRSGPNAPPDDPAANPDINIGTGTMDRSRWAPLVDRVLSDLCQREVLGRPLDVRENVNFFGGNFPQWVHETFPASGCALAIEVKKFYMNEWTGQLDDLRFAAVERALASAVPGLFEELKRRDDARKARRRYIRRTSRSGRRPARAEPTGPTQPAR